MAKKSTIKKKDINLLPRQYNKKSAVVSQVNPKIFVGGFVASVVIVVGVFAGLNIYGGILDKLDSSYKEDINKYSEVTKVIQENDTVKKDLQMREAFMASAFGAYKQTQLLQWFGGAIPSGSGMKFTNYSSNLININTTVSGRNLKDLDAYVRNIRKAGLYPTLKIQTANGDDKTNKVVGTVQASFQTQQLVK